jgi:hypothetical protein
VNTSVAVISGLGASAFFAVGNAYQYKAAAETNKTAPTSAGIDVGSVVRFLRVTFSSRHWLTGTAFLAVGLALHALALHNGPLTLVEPLLVTGVLFALPTSRRAGGPPITVADMRWAVILVAALAVFLVTATPASQPTHPNDGGPAWATFALSVLGITACLVIARRVGGNAAATALGVSAGVALADSASLIKVCTDIAARDVNTLVTGWQLYALAAVGAAAVLLGQLAYRAGPMVASLPAANTVNPVVSVIIGVTVFDERFRSGFFAVTIVCASLAVVVVAAAALSVSESAGGKG